MTELQPGSSTCAATRHDTVNAYKNHQCRCPLAVHAWSRYMKDYRLRRLRQQPAIIDGTGTRRRIRALQAIGWTTELIGARLGCTGNAISQLAHRRMVYVTTARQVAHLYTQLADTAGPSRYNATLARGRGWLAPLWWDDDTIDDPTHRPRRNDGSNRTHRDKYDVDPIAVERALAGDPPTDLRRGERLEAARRLREMGLGYQPIADRLHVDQRQVARDLADLQLTRKPMEVSA